MRTGDVKKFIYTTKRNLSAEEVKTIISTIKKHGKVTKDRTGEGYVYHCWEGVPPFPVLPEDHGLVFRGENPGSFGVGITIAPKALKQDPSLGTLCRMIRLSRLRPHNELLGEVGVSKLKDVSRVEFCVGLGATPFNISIQVQEQTPISLAARQALLSELLAVGSWPVTLASESEGITPQNTAGGTAAWNDEKRELSFSWPGASAQQAVEAFARTVGSPDFKVGDIRFGFTLPDGTDNSWVSLNRFLRALEKEAIPSMSFGLFNIEWHLNGYDSFAAMVPMHAVLDTDQQIMTKMFEFEFTGQLGFMELAHEKTGFCAWFSLDDEKQFKALQKAIGFPLKPWN